MAIALIFAAPAPAQGEPAAPSGAPTERQTDAPTDTPSGPLLVELAPDGPLARAGARGADRQAILGSRRIYLGGDLLTAVDDIEIGDYETLRALLERQRRIGDAVRVTLYRGGDRIEAEVELQERPRRAARR